MRRCDHDQYDHHGGVLFRKEKTQAGSIGLGFVWVSADFYFQGLFCFR